VTLSTAYPLPYGLARLQARIGDLPTAAEWTSLRSAVGLGPFLDAARRGPLRVWLTLFLRLFHRHCTTPLAAFSYLGLILLDIRLLRAELQRRLLFPIQGVVS